MCDMPQLIMGYNPICFLLRLSTKTADLFIFKSQVTVAEV
jgi:hypothetical protein